MQWSSAPLNQVGTPYWEISTSLLTPWCKKYFYFSDFYLCSIGTTLALNMTSHLRSG